MRLTHRLHKDILLRRVCALLTVTFFVAFSESTNAAELEWTGQAGDADFYNEANWILVAGSIDDAVVGESPPLGTIDPFAVGGAPIAHDLRINQGTANMEVGDLGLDANMGSLTINGEGEVTTPQDDPAAIMSLPSSGAGVTATERSSLSANYLDGIQLDLRDEANVSLASDDPLRGDIQVMLTSMPSPCLVLDGVSPGNALTMYMDNITTSPGSEITFGNNNPFGTIIKAANSPEPSGMMSLFVGVGLLSLFRKRVQSSHH